MTDADKGASQATDNSAPVSGPGKQLRAAREAQGRSLDDVVHELRLEMRVIQAIENDALDDLGAPVFVKGYLRSYARLLGLPEQPLIAAYHPAESGVDEFRVLSARQEVRSGPNLMLLVLLGLLVLLVVGVTVYLLGDDAPAPEADAERSAEFVAADPDDELSAAARIDADFVVPPDELPDTLPPPAVEVDEVQAVLPAAPDEAAVVAQAPVVETAPRVTATDTVSLELLFTDECWVEVSDASRRLLYGLEKPGVERRFDAKPPFRFFVGNADAVRIRIAGEDYRIPPTVRTGRNTARFSLSAVEVEEMQ